MGLRPPEVADAGTVVDASAAVDLAALWIETRPVALRYARTLVWDGELTEDLVSEAFARVATAIDSGRVDAGRSPRGYLLATVRSVCLNALRRRGVESRPLPLRSAPATPEEVAVDRGDGERVLTALAALPERHRTVLWLLDVEQLPVVEAAVVCGVSVNACYQLQHRARSALRARYVEAIAPSRGPVCDEVARQLAAGATLSADGKGHVEECPVCRERRDELVGFGVRFSAVMVGVAASADGVRPAAHARPRARQWAAAVAAAAVVVAGAAVFPLRAGEREPQRPSPSDRPTAQALKEDDLPPIADDSRPDDGSGRGERGAGPRDVASASDRSAPPTNGGAVDVPVGREAEVLGHAPRSPSPSAIPAPLVSATVSVGGEEVTIELPSVPPVPPVLDAEVVADGGVTVEVTVLPPD